MAVAATMGMAAAGHSPAGSTTHGVLMSSTPWVVAAPVPGAVTMCSTARWWTPAQPGAGVGVFGVSLAMSWSTSTLGGMVRSWGGVVRGATPLVATNGG